MPLTSLLRRHRSQFISGTGIVVASCVIAAAAIFYQGVTKVEVDLNDGGVWVTNSISRMLGHLNFPAQSLDGGVKPAGKVFNVLQEANTVLLQNVTGSTLTPVNPATVAIESGSAQLPPNAQVALGGDTVSILEPSTGKLWVTSSSAVANFRATDDPVRTLGKNAAVAVGQDGTVYAASSAQAALYRIAVDSQGNAGSISSTSLGGVKSGSALTVTVVGSSPVVLDGVRDRLYLPDASPVTVPAQSVLQQSSAASVAQTVLLESPTALIEQPLNGQAASSRPAGRTGQPIAPVYLGGCAYAAWSGSARYLRDCVGTQDDQAAQTINSASPLSTFVFRVNRDVVVLNDVNGGSVWLLNKGQTKVSNWNDIIPASDQEQSDQASQGNQAATAAERSAVNTPPVAVDDVFGVRPGRTVILPVLDNDSDADGDVLTASLVGPNPSIGTVQPANDGAQLQIVVKSDASGTATFRYQVSDGRAGGTDQANVTLNVSAPGTNSPPVQRRIATVLVEQGATVKYNALPDWNDPDGDDLFLKSATTASGEQVRYSPDGTVTFAAVSPSTGTFTVPIVVSDGITPTTGALTFDVRPAGTLKPQTNADHVVARVGQRVTVSPLANDVSPSGKPLRLAQVSTASDAQIVTDFVAGTFSFIGSTAQTYYLTYIATDGPNQATGLIRIDVTAPPSQDAAPVAVSDVVYLPHNGQALVDVLANDSDPGGRVLVVQSVDNASTPGVSVEIVQHNILRVTDTGGITGPVEFTYTISNGMQSASAGVDVIPVPAPQADSAPVAVPDSATVRADDIVNIPVLANDTHADGTTLSLKSTLAEPLDTPDAGTLFISGNELRFKAAATTKATTVHATYIAVDNLGQSSAAQVTINILPVDLATNSPPQPQTVTARAIAGTTIRIPIPLDGIDPNGDSVTLVGQSVAPTLGRIVSVGQNWLDYQAYAASAGTDSFSYEVRDNLGATAVGQLFVGVAPGTGVNHPPVTVPDAITMRPGRSASVDVLANDSDPDGDTITLVAGSLVVPSGIAATIADSEILVNATQASGDKFSRTVQYTIKDSHGATAYGSLQVTVDPAAPLLAPDASDDIVTGAEEAGKQTIDVPVLLNDVDPDGVTSELTVSSSDPQAQVLANGVVRVTLLPTAQKILYTDTDRDGLKGSAFIIVPGIADQYPTLKTDFPPVKVVSGATVTLPLSTYVSVAAGKTPIITEAAKVTASHSNGASLVESQSTLTYTSAANYSGQDAISFEVTDGSGPDDPKGHKAVLVIPITVTPPPVSPVPPTFLGATVNVAPGEDAIDTDLLALTTDTNPGGTAKLTYKLLSTSPSWLTTSSVSGHTLSLAAAASAVVGSTATVQVSVTDGLSTPATGTVNVTVTRSARPLAVAANLTVPNAVQGHTYTEDVLGQATNPFAPQALHIVSASVVSGTGVATVTSGSSPSVQVTPDSSFFGTLVVSYRIGDVTQDSTREVTGTITLTVAGRPQAPLTPTVQSVADSSVVLTWPAPADDGSPITGYTVKAQGFSQQCVSTSCTLTGLTNNTTYNFTVTATNAVGDSPASPASAPARPDVVPATPVAPTLAFGDSKATVSWVPPTTHGSAITSYTLQISPAVNGLTQVTVQNVNNVSSYVWTGLTNGTSYTVQLEATNLAGASGWSPSSTPVVPAGVPAAPAAPTVTKSTSVGTQEQLLVTWNTPANNGDAVSSYTLNKIQNGTTTSIPVSPSGGTQVSQAVTVDVSADSYTFTVTATNKAGTSAASPASAALRAVNPPDAPTNIAVTPGNNQVSVTFTPGASNGATASELSYQYSVSGGAWLSDWVSGGTGSSGTIGNGHVNNNGTYTIAVRGISTTGGAGASSDASAAVAPYGPPNAPGAGASGGGSQVNLQWAPPAANGRPITTLEISVDGGGWQNVGVSSGNENVGSYSQTHSITVRATDSVGQQSTNSASATSGAAPPPPPPAGPTTWQITVDTARTCAQDQLNVSRYSGGSCNSPGAWIAASTVLTISCYSTSANLSSGGDHRFYYIYSGTGAGLWVAQYTMHSPWDSNIPTGMPTC